MSLDLPNVPKCLNIILGCLKPCVWVSTNIWLQIKTPRYVTANYFNCADKERHCFLFPWDLHGRRLKQNNAMAAKCSASYNAYLSSPDCRWCTYHRQKGVADAESRLRGEIFIRDEANADLAAFGNVTSWHRLRPAPATQERLLSRIFYFHKVVPGRVRQRKSRKRLNCSLSFHLLITALKIHRIVSVELR